MLSLSPFSNALSKSWSGYPFDVFGNVHKELERVFERGSRKAFPAVNLWANEDAAVVTAELPGFDPSEVEVALENNQLVLKGARKQEGGDQYRRQERWSGQFERAFKLPFAVEADKVEASFDNGVLEVKLPRREADKPRKIAVKNS